MDEAAKALGDKGEFAIITSSLTAANQNEWIKNIKQRLEENILISSWPLCAHVMI